MKNIVLIGFMGTGKTTAGRLLANSLERPYINTDQLLEQESGMTISEIFRVHGEKYFRQKERDVIALVSDYEQVVIDTGGGAVTDPANMIRLKNSGILIALTARLDVILKRTEGCTSRPLLARPDKEKAVALLLQQRAKLYKQADFTVDTSDLSPQLVAEEMLVLLREGGI